jgi:hypothetical protein
MTEKEVEAALRANAGQRAHITFDDGVVQVVDIHGVDDEGFLHSGPGGENPPVFWTRFGSVVSVEPVEHE